MEEVENNKKKTVLVFSQSDRYFLEFSDTTPNEVFLKKHKPKK